MNRMLTTLLVLTFCMAGFAVAGDGSPTVYGKVNLSYSMHDNGTDSGMNLTSNSSRIGFKGYEELDDFFIPVKAFYQVESSINWTGNAGNWASRNTFAGLKTEDYGSILVGRHDTPFKDVGAAFDLFRDQIGDSRNAIHDFGDGFDMRMNRILMYSSPVYEGFKLNAMVSEDPAEVMSFNAMYKKADIGGGTIMAAAGLEMHSDEYINMPESEMGIRGGVSYWQDMFKVNGFFQMVSNTGGVADVSAMVYGGGACYKINDEFKVKGQGFLLDPNTDVDDDGAMMMAFGVDYMASKRTSLYAAFAMMTNEDMTMNWQVGNGGYDDFDDGVGALDPAANGDSSMGIGVGVVHSF